MVKSLRLIRLIRIIKLYKYREDVGAANKKKKISIETTTEEENE